MSEPTDSAKKSIVIQEVTEDSINVLVDGVSQQIQKKLDVLQEFMEKQAAKSLQSANNIYNIGSITNANFGYLMGQAGHDKALPPVLAQNIIGADDGWIKSLGRELVKQGVSVSNQPWDIFQNYDWLIQAFLQKMMSPDVGQVKNLRRLSFMAEAYQASLRFLCYIQLAQILQIDPKPKLGIVSDFIQMEGAEYLEFDYTSLLLVTTDEINKAGPGFMPEINDFIKDLTDKDQDLFGTAIYLQDQRQKLLKNTIAEDDKFPALLDEYLTALAYWLRCVSFVANYSLVSIKDINLDYRLGTAKNFIHRYGELHSVYNEGGSSADGDYKLKSITDTFTFSKSVLLLKGNSVSTSMGDLKDPSTALSLSPLVIDQSVYAEKSTQTPEIFYYAGYLKAKRQYHYAQYKNELTYGGKGEITSNKYITVASQNNDQSKLDDLFEQLGEIFEPLKIKAS